LNSFDETLHRLLARREGRALLKRTSSPLSSDPALTIGIATIKIVTEEQIQAIAFGRLESAPNVCLRLNPIGRDVTDLAPFAEFLSGVARRAVDHEEPLRIWIPHAATLESLDILGHRYASNPNASDTIKRMGQICRIVAHEATIPGQQLVANAATLLQDQVVTGLTPLEEGHLGAILAWMDPTVSDPLTEARTRIRIPASGVLPNTPDQPLDDRVDRLRRDMKSAQGRRRNALEREIANILCTAVLREWELLVGARQAFLNLGLSATGLQALDKDSNERVQEMLRAGAFYPARRPDRLSIQLDVMEMGQEKSELAALENDAVLRQRCRQYGPPSASRLQALRHRSRYRTGNDAVPDRRQDSNRGIERHWDRTGVHAGSVRRDQDLHCHRQRRAVARGSDGGRPRGVDAGGLWVRGLSRDEGGPRSAIVGVLRRRGAQPAARLLAGFGIGSSARGEALMSTALQIPSNDADRVLEEAIAGALFGPNPISIVKSPPGAGKTYLVECAVAVAVGTPGLRVAVVTPGVSQLYDIADRLLAYRQPRLELVHASHRQLPPELQGRINQSNGWTLGLNVGPGVIVTNVHVLSANLAKLGRDVFDLLILDEAYQLAATDFMKIAHLAPRVLMVGDPGQLKPVVSVDTANLEASPHKIHWSAPSYVLDRFPNTPVHRLPVTRRLLPDTADLVQASFYRDLPFQSVVDPSDRRLRFRVEGVERGINQALNAIASGRSLVGITLPGSAPAHAEADIELAALMAHVADRVLTRQAEWVGHRVLTDDDIGCIDPHVISGGSISDALRQRGRGGIRVDTVERWQGLQMPISIIRHPLSLIERPTAFDLEAGRWCVSLSRHQIGCIIVARESVTDVIRDYVHGCDTVAAGARDVAWEGFEAHRTIWQTLTSQGRVFRL
jgi:hypothetical protein